MYINDKLRNSVANDRIAQDGYFSAFFFFSCF